MCIIIHKPEGANMPSRAELREHWRVNPHGAGFWIKIEDESKFAGCAYWAQKGFMDFEHFVETIEAFDIHPDEEAAFHFRYATAGRINRGATHPFPISQSPGKVEEDSFIARRAMMHNGTIGRLSGDRKYSDSQVFAMSVLYHARHKLNNAATLRKIEQVAAPSRLLIAVDGNTHRLGQWYQYQGRFYSKRPNVGTINFKRGKKK